MKSRSKSVKKGLCAGSAVLVAALIGSTGFITAAAASGNYYVDKTRTEYAEASRELNGRIMQEGMVLLKNDGALPLAKSSSVTVLGAGSFNPYWGDGTAAEDDYTYVSDSLKSAGFNVNPDTQAVYEANSATEKIAGVNVVLEPAVSALDGVKSTFTQYGDAAIITLSRYCVENYDLVNTAEGLAGTAIEGAAHQLALYPNEKALIKAAKESFGKVIVLLNSPTVMQIPELAETDGEYEADAIVYIGLPGQYGLDALGSVLNGDVSPSGRTVDLWSADFTKDPTYANAAERIDSIDGTNSVEYEEGIYLGYKYYETAYAEAQKGNYEGFDYDSAVVYPFGYGLSYTTFKQELVTESVDISGKAFDDYVEIEVKVTNTGDCDGKEVVQIYNNAPYTTGGIEKSEVTLVGFAKTSTLSANGGEETVKVAVRVGDLASYDYNDANGNDWYGYEIESGSYSLRLQSDSHTVIDSLALTVDATIKFNNDGSLAAADGENQPTAFSDGCDFDTLALVSAANGGDFKVMSRANFAGTFPTAPTGNNNYKSGVPTMYSDIFTPDMDSDQYPWYVESVPDSWTQGAATSYTLYDMAGIDYTSDDVITEGVWEGKTGAEAWEIFMNQLTWDELKQLVSSGTHSTVSIPSINKIRQSDLNGPTQLGSGTFWACANIMGGTFNTELMYERGEAMAKEALLDGVNGWYGPGANLNRSPFGGRTHSYLSEDSLLTGKLVASLISGAQENGLVCYVKHFALNEQETERKGLGTYLTEQALRETYLKSFEYCIKEGGALGIMQALNRIGAVNGSGHYALDVTVLREEWGYKGVVITDAYNASLVRENMLQRVGGDFPLGSYSLPLAGDWDGTKVTYNGVASPTQWSAVRNSAMHLLYMAANSNQVVNGYNIAAFTNQTLPLENGKLVLTAGETVNLNLGVDSQSLGTTNVKYEASGLPAGLTLNADTGVLSGAPTSVGNGKFTVSVKITGEGEEWITGTITVAYTVSDAQNNAGSGTGSGGGSNAGLIAGLCVGGAVVIAAAVTVTVIVLKKKKSSK